jgi:hypothetical protein
MLLMRGWLLLSSVIGALWLTSISTAFAQAPAHSSKNASLETREYRRAVQSALAEFDAGNFPEARALFTRAHALYPNARTYRGLGFVAFELRNYIECVSYLGAALASSEKPLSDSLHSSTEELLARAKGMIARIQVDVSPSSRAVLVDGVPVEIPEGQPLVLEVGDHIVELKAAGYVSERRALKIAGGEELSLNVQLRELPAEPAKPALLAATAPGTTSGQDAPAKKPMYKNPWLWTALGVVVVGAGVVTAVVLSSPTKQVEPGAPQTGDNTPPGGVIQAWVGR